MKMAFQVPLSLSIFFVLIYTRKHRLTACINHPRISVALRLVTMQIAPSKNAEARGNERVRRRKRSAKVRTRALKRPVIDDARAFIKRDDPVAIGIAAPSTLAGRGACLSRI